VGEIVVKDFAETPHTCIPTSAFRITLNMNDSHSGYYSSQVFSASLTLWTKLFL